MSSSNYLRLARVTAVLVFILIVLGAWVRLSDAGLGCPDWPGCFGHITWPTAAHEVSAASEAFPDSPVDGNKAMKEMVHRYVAGPVGILILLLAIFAWRRRHNHPQQPVWVATLLVPVVAAQALLGMLTVTLKVKPAIVTLHLIGGLTTFALTILLLMQLRGRTPLTLSSAGRRWLKLGFAALLLQIFLGGWTSTNYAALACPDFPTCQYQWWPETDFTEAFVLWREVGVNYEGGILDQPARNAIHLSHRLGAMIVFFVLSLLALRLWRHEQAGASAIVLFALLVIQLSLGIFNVILGLPLLNAVAHNGGAALLLAWIVVLFHRFRRPDLRYQQPG